MTDRHIQGHQPQKGVEKGVRPPFRLERGSDPLFKRGGAGRWRARLVAGVTALALSLPVLAADARTQLSRFYEQVTAAVGEFVQQTEGDNGAAPRRTSGEFAFQRPGRFKWHVREPFEQVIVSDGQVVQQYDPDLAQVSRRRVSQALGASPAALLFGAADLDQHFELSALPDAGGMAWLRARPRNTEAGFTHLDIGLHDDVPSRLMLLDAFGQTSRIDFTRIDRNPRLPADAFDLQLPPDVDVLPLD